MGCGESRKGAAKRERNGKGERENTQGIKIGEIKNVPLTISFFIYTSLLKGLVDRKKKNTLKQEGRKRVDGGRRRERTEQEYIKSYLLFVTSVSLNSSSA